MHNHSGSQAEQISTGSTWQSGEQVAGGRKLSQCVRGGKAEIQFVRMGDSAFGGWVQD